MRRTPDPATTGTHIAGPPAPAPHLTPDGRWLLRQHRLLISRHTARLGRALAEDLASEALVRSLTNPPPDGRYGPWMETVFQNLMVDDHRRGGRIARHVVSAPQPAAPETPEHAVTLAQLRQRLSALWPRLRPEWQQAIQASFFEDDRAALAARSQVAPQTVRTRLHRALGAVRQALGVVRGWLPLPMGIIESRPMLAALLPGAFALTTVLSPQPPGADQTHQVDQPRRAQRLQARPTTDGTTPAPTPAAVPVRPPSKPFARPAPRTNDPGERQASAPQRYDFEDDNVSGDLQRPDDFVIFGPPGRSTHQSLIEIPGSFVAALARSVEDQ